MSIHDYFTPSEVLGVMIEAATIANGHWQIRSDAGEFEPARCACGWESDTATASTQERDAAFDAHANERYLAEPIRRGYVGDLGPYHRDRYAALAKGRVPMSVEAWRAERAANDAHGRGVARGDDARQPRQRSAR